MLRNFTVHMQSLFSWGTHLNIRRSKGSRELRLRLLVSHQLVNLFRHRKHMGSPRSDLGVIGKHTIEGTQPEHVHLGPGAVL